MPALRPFRQGVSVGSGVGVGRVALLERIYYVRIDLLMIRTQLQGHTNSAPKAQLARCLPKPPLRILNDAECPETLQKPLKSDIFDPSFALLSRAPSSPKKHHAIQRISLRPPSIE
jgi:hypothetical protein